MKNETTQAAKVAEMSIVGKFGILVKHLFRLTSEQSESLSDAISRGQWTVEQYEPDSDESKDWRKKTRYSLAGVPVHPRLAAIFVHWGLSNLQHSTPFHKHVINWVHYRVCSVLSRHRLPQYFADDCKATAIEILYNACEKIQFLQPLPLYQKSEPFVIAWQRSDEANEKIEKKDIFEFSTKQGIDQKTELTAEKMAELIEAIDSDEFLMFRTSRTGLPTIKGIQRNVFYTACNMAVKQRIMLELGPQAPNMKKKSLSVVSGLASEVKEDFISAEDIRLGKMEATARLLDLLTDTEKFIFEMKCRLTNTQDDITFEEMCDMVGMSLSTAEKCWSNIKRKGKEVTRWMVEQEEF